MHPPEMGPQNDKTPHERALNILNIAIQYAHQTLHEIQTQQNTNPTFSRNDAFITLKTEIEMRVATAEVLPILDLNHPQILDARRIIQAIFDDIASQTNPAQPLPIHPHASPSASQNRPQSDQGPNFNPDTV